VARDGDADCLALFERHYSCKEYKDGRVRRLFCGPGAKLVLVTPDLKALFVWRKFKDDSGQEGVNCAVFRNEGAGLASALILEAEEWAWRRWPDEKRLYTYVNGKKIRSKNPGFCFLKAGWTRLPYVTKWNKLAVLEKWRPGSMPIAEGRCTKEGGIGPAPSAKAGNS